MKKIQFIATLLLAIPLALSAQLISAADLQKELGSKNLVILGLDDAGAKIPGSRAIEYKNVRDKDDNVQDAKLFEALMQREGVNNDSKVVIVESGKGYGSFHPAARLYWTFKYFGFDNVYILNGGLQEWTIAGGAISDERPKRARGNFKAKEPRAEIYASTEQVKAAVGKQTIVDARPFANYMGVEKPGVAKQNGHIDGAKAAPLTDYFKSGSVLHSKENLAAFFEGLNIDMSKESIVYCNTGSFAAVGWYVMHEMLGKKVRMYDGSMKEWDGPVATALQN